MSEPKDDSLDIFEPSEHTQRAQDFMGGISEIEGEYPDIKFKYSNVTMNLADIYGKTAQTEDNPEYKKAFQEKSNEIDAESANQTSVLVSLLGDNFHEMTSVKREIAFLSDKYRGKDEDRSKIIDLLDSPTEKSKGMRYAYHTTYVFRSES
ncbi:MAG TPA: hypothetical protein VLE44_02490 [Candidatus Saccharimonadales bacterium]|nr:hypothetical protein [Candidatus Saccharimonadales bacterium]